MYFRNYIIILIYILRFYNVFGILILRITLIRLTFIVILKSLIFNSKSLIKLYLINDFLKLKKSLILSKKLQIFLK